jgi:hypothetical protein
MTARRYKHIASLALKPLQHYALAASIYRNYAGASIFVGATTARLQRKIRIGRRANLAAQSPFGHGEIQMCDRF